jgi:NSS family neurotransmitter:Na+ symporter
VVGSVLFALPTVIDPGLNDNGTMGLTLLDMVSHWNFDYGLLLVGLVECVLVGWVMGPETIRQMLNENSRMKLGPWFDFLIKWAIPAVILFLLGWSVAGEFRNGLYGTPFSENYSEGFRWMRFVPVLIVVFWLAGGAIVGWILANKGTYADEAERDDEGALGT